MRNDNMGNNYTLFSLRIPNELLEAIKEVAKNALSTRRSNTHSGNMQRLKNKPATGIS